MRTGQIEVVEESIYNFDTQETETNKHLQISDTPLQCGDLLEVLTPKGWKETRLCEKFDGEWAFTDLPLKPIGLIARTQRKTAFDF